MDDLDRLYYDFVEILRRERPAALRDESLTFAELHDRVIPYHRVRNRVGFPTYEDYEAALSRMLSGERGYVVCDRGVQAELRAGLEESLPDIRRFLAYPDVQLQLNPEKVPPPGDIRYAPPELREGVDWAQEAIDAKAAETLTAAPEEEAPGADETMAEPQSPLPYCPNCGGQAPQGAAFCPFCGRRLLPDVCPACGAELDADWSFCPRCGARKNAGSNRADSA